MYLRVLIYVNNRRIAFATFGDNAQSSLIEAVDHFVLSIQNAPLFEVGIVDNELAIEFLQEHMVSQQFIDELCHNVHHMIHPMQPGVLFFDGPVMLEFQQIIEPDIN